MKARGFTLVEIIAVLVVLGLLLAIALPRLLDRFGASEAAMSEVTKDLIAERSRLFAIERGITVTGTSCFINLPTLVDMGVIEEGLIKSNNYADRYHVVVEFKANTYVVTLSSEARNGLACSI